VSVPVARRARTTNRSPSCLRASLTRSVDDLVAARSRVGDSRSEVSRICARSTIWSAGYVPSPRPCRLPVGVPRRHLPARAVGPHRDRRAIMARRISPRYRMTALPAVAREMTRTAFDAGGAPRMAGLVGSELKEDGTPAVRPLVRSAKASPGIRRRIGYGLHALRTRSTR
jgi:hypothetical protein